MRVMFVSKEKGILPCPFCSTMKLAAETLNNSKRVEDQIRTKYIENNDSITMDQFRSNATPVLVYDDLEMTGASEFHNTFNTLVGVDRFKKGLRNVHIE